MNFMAQKYLGLVKNMHNTSSFTHMSILVRHRSHKRSVLLLASTMYIKIYSNIYIFLNFQMCKRSLQRGSDDLKDFRLCPSDAYQDTHCLCHYSTNVHLHTVLHIHNLTRWSMPFLFFFSLISSATGTGPPTGTPTPIGPYT